MSDQNKAATTSTARERAREAATETRPNLSEYDPADCADAASDVWEPVVRDLFDLVGKFITDDDHEWTDEEDRHLDAVYLRAKTALGNGS